MPRENMEMTVDSLLPVIHTIYVGRENAGSDSVTTRGSTRQNRLDRHEYEDRSDQKCRDDVKAE